MNDVIILLTFSSVNLYNKLCVLHDMYDDDDEMSIYKSVDVKKFFSKGSKIDQQLYLTIFNKRLFWCTLYDDFEQKKMNVGT